MTKKGLIYVFGAYAIWGFFPIYFKLLQAVPAIQIVAHRISWSFIILLILVSLKGQLKISGRFLTRESFFFILLLEFYYPLIG